MSATVLNAPAPDESALQARVAVLEHALREQTARADATVKELDGFAHAISHDLRAPLRGITGFTRVLLEEHGMKLDDEGRRVLHLIRDDARRMGEHIEGMLVFSRIGRQRLEPSEIDMTELARSAFQQLVEVAPAHVPALEIKNLPRAEGDRGMIRHVFANVLGNAIKFTRPQPAAHIAISGWVEGERSVYCVADNGVGFDPRHAHKLFAPFQRLHSDAEFEGGGMGLAVAQRIVSRHGGRIWVEARPGAGAKFFFTLPSAKGTQA